MVGCSNCSAKPPSVAQGSKGGAGGWVGGRWVGPVGGWTNEAVASLRAARACLVQHVPPPPTHPPPHTASSTCPHQRSDEGGSSRGSSSCSSCPSRSCAGLKKQVHKRAIERGIGCAAVQNWQQAHGLGRALSRIDLQLRGTPLPLRFTRPQLLERCLQDSPGGWLQRRSLSHAPGEGVGLRVHAAIPCAADDLGASQQLGCGAGKHGGRKEGCASAHQGGGGGGGVWRWHCNAVLSESSSAAGQRRRGATRARHRTGGASSAGALSQALSQACNPPLPACRSQMGTPMLHHTQAQCFP